MRPVSKGSLIRTLATSVPTTSRASAAWTTALALVVLAGFGLRLVRAVQSPVLPDEEICIGIAERVFEPGEAWPLHGGDHPALGIYLLAASAWSFGRSLVGYRVLGVLAGSATLILVAASVARSTSRGKGLLAAFLLAVNPFHVGLSSAAFELVFQILFVSVAWLWLARLPEGGRPALVGAAVALGLAFLCNESAALVGVGWTVALLARVDVRTRLRLGDGAVAAACLLAVITPDLIYNLTATAQDFRYVNYADHFIRISQPTVQLQGLGFFLRDLFNRLLPASPALWSDTRCEYAGPGIVLGSLLFMGFVHSLRPGADPGRGLWRWPVLLFVLVTSLTAPAGPTELDPPSWTWPAPVLPLATAATAQLLCGPLRRLWPGVLLLLYIIGRIPHQAAPPCL